MSPNFEYFLCFLLGFCASISINNTGFDLDTFDDDDHGVQDFSEFIFDVERYQLIVGARNALFRLSLESLTLLEKVEWTANEVTQRLCVDKGRSLNECHNFIKILTLHTDELFVCGTNAFKPMCSWRPINELNRVKEWIDGRGKCPYSSHDKTTTLMTTTTSLNSAFYVGSSIDFSSADYSFFRMSDGPQGKFSQLLVSERFNSFWLAQPIFVASFETRDFVYFLFRETSIESINCVKVIYSRIARVCKNDGGGSLIRKHIWTTFLKARLNCSRSGPYPFYFDEISSAFYVSQDSTVYATFVTPPNFPVLVSAICSFNLTAIETAFNGPFKAQPRSDSMWQPIQQADHRHFNCEFENETSSSNFATVNSHLYQLVDQAVQGVSLDPLFQETAERYTHIVVDTLGGRRRRRHILFVATQSGLIKKFLFDTKNIPSYSFSQACLIQNMYSLPHSTINNIKFLSTTNSLYITTSKIVIRLRTQQCLKFATKDACLDSMDPYCEWNHQQEECTTESNSNVWQQEPFDQCPSLNNDKNLPQASWSKWSVCDYVDGNSCLCKRLSDSSRIYVTNCTLDGDWTPWSEWSDCSRSSGNEIRRRSRSCSNPRPKFGGRVCIGLDVDTKRCRLDENLICGSLKWSQWSECSLKCGKTRTRNGCNAGVEEFQACADSNLCKNITSENNFVFRPIFNDAKPKGNDKGEIIVDAYDGVFDHYYIGVIGGILLSFLIGFVLGALTLYLLRFRLSGTFGRFNGQTKNIYASNYVSAKSTNLYVSLPLLDLKNASSSNFSDMNSDAGTIISTIPRIDYENATIKRSSKLHRASACLLDDGSCNF